MGDNLPAVDLGTGVSAVAVSAGSWRTCALLNTSQIKCWGMGSSGRLGSGSTADIGGASGESGNHFVIVYVFQYAECRSAV